MKIPNKIYDILKWVLMIVVPAFITLFTLLAKTWNWNIPVVSITTTISGIATFIGVVVGISNHNYNKEHYYDEVYE